MPIIRRFDPDEYSNKISSIPTEDLVEFMCEEGPYIWGIEDKKILIRHELMFSLIKRELSLRGVLQTIKFTIPEPVKNDPDYDDGYNDGNDFDDKGDPGNWWKP